MRLEGIGARLKYVWLIFAILSITLPVNIVYAGTDDYPSPWREAPIDSMIDSWSYYNRECTSFAAWRLHARNKFETPRGMSNASNWGYWAKNNGYAVDRLPSVGALAWFSSHVAWVEAVNGNVVTIEEYNHVDSNGNGKYGDDGTYSTRTISAGSAKGYIHFQDISSGVRGLDFKGNDRLAPNEVLKVNQYLLSPDVQFALVMQPDGNLVLYGNRFRALWATNTSGSYANRAVMQSDGNLVLYTADSRPVWHSKTNGQGISDLFVQDDGNVVVYAAGRRPTWASNSGGWPSYNYLGSNQLGVNQVIRLNQYIRSADKRYGVLLRGNGDLIVYGPGDHILWNSFTVGQSVAYAIMQSDGNLVLYTAGDRPVWSSNTAGEGPSYAIMQSDGNFVIYTTSGKATWHTHTQGEI